jgi:hypothetical protein
MATAARNVADIAGGGSIGKGATDRALPTVS